MQPTLLKPKEVMKRLNVGRNTFYHLVNSGTLKSVRVGIKGRSIRVSEEAINNYIKNQEGGA